MERARAAALARILVAAIGAAGCMVDNPSPRADGGPGDAGGGGTDDGDGLDGGADAGLDAGGYLACGEGGDVCAFDGDGELVGVVEDCPDANAYCAESDAGVPACFCEGNFDPAADCAACATGWGGEACAVCEIGYGGAGCGDCAGAFVPAGGACANGDLCGADALWLIGGALPGTNRTDDEFALGGTAGEATTIDLVTGLEWQRCPSGTEADGAGCAGGFPTAVTYAEAEARCYAPFAGHGDWRLPEAGELQSVLDYAAASHLNDGFFGSWPPLLWSATVEPGGTQRLALDFEGPALSVPEGLHAYAVCVRSVAPTPAPTPRFAVAAADGATVLDTWTGREWRRCPYGESWDGAACAGAPALYEPYSVAPHDDDAACGDEWAGHADWRLPSAAELTSLIAWCDPDRPYLLEAFGAPLAALSAGGAYWSSTMHFGTFEVYAFSFAGRTAATLASATPLPALCVRDPD